jgi:hypothetical protein
MKTILKLAGLVMFATLLAACSSKPIQYGDQEGMFLNPSSLIQKNVYAAYPGDVQPLDKVGVVALDSRLDVQGLEVLGGEKITAQVFTTGPSLLRASTLSQYHFLPGKYLVALCFNIDGGNGSRVYCRDNLTVPLDIQPGSKLQLSLDFPDRGRWTALQQPPSEAARAKLVADFENIMAANKKPVASAK